jgi:replicative DNA helicase
MQKGLNSGVNTFEAGINVADPEQALSFLDQHEKPMRWGVEALERFDVGPAPKTLFLLMGATNKGKSWGLVNIGKHALLNRKSVVHITLEMSQEKVTARYMQALFSVTKNEGEIRVPRFGRGNTTVPTIEFDELNRPSLRDKDIYGVLETMITRRLVRRAPLKIKGFPSGTLTMAGLRSYLDSIERFEGWSPEVIIVDTAELMALDPKDIRGSTGRLYVDLRGIGDERNAAMVTGSQVNRAGMGKQTSDETDLAEDISKAFTCDTIVTYNQTALEYKMGLARLYVAKNRDGEAKMTALITQSYPMGQFCLDSRLMGDSYLQSLRPRRDDDDEDDAPRRRTRS